MLLPSFLSPNGDSVGARRWVPHFHGTEYRYSTPTVRH
jgi:hypothetical protein